MAVGTNAPGAYKKIILRLGVGFFIVMLLLTFFSGTLNNIALAKVSVVSPTSNSLQKVVAADGAFAAKEVVDVNLEVAGKISKVLVKEGDRVKAGDTLLKMDLADLQQQIETEKDTLQKMQNNRAKSKLTVAPDYTAQNVAIAKAKEIWQTAQADYDALKATGTATADQLAAARQAVTDAHDDYKIKVSALAQQKKQDSNQKKGTALDLKNADLDIQAQKDKIATMEKQQKDNAQIKAKTDGIIQTVNVKEGAQANLSQPAMTMLDTAKGMEFSVDVSNDNADLMAVGDHLDIHLEDTTDSVAGTIDEKANSTANPGQMSTVTIGVSAKEAADNGVQPNQKGDIRYASDTTTYGMTLPNGAVREDGNGYFVLVAQQKHTPLGDSLVLKRVDITVTDSDSYRTAVSGGLSPGDQVVDNSDKDVADGDVVRLEQ